MKYKDLAIPMFNFSASFAVREHSIWKQLFLTNGNGMEWRNGELFYRFNDKPVDKPETLAEAALDMVKDKSNFKEASYWFDHYYVDHQARLNPKKLVGIGYIDNAPYNMLWVLPANITDEWVAVVNSCIKWLESIDEASFTNYNLKSTKQSFFGQLYDKYQPQVLAEHPEWKAIRDKHKEATKDMEWVDRVCFRDATYEAMHKELCLAIHRITDPMAEKDVKGHFTRMQELIKFTKDRLTGLGKSTENLSEPLNLIRDISIPEWYIKPENRPDKLFIRDDRHGACTLSSPWLDDFTLDELRAMLPA